MEEFFVGKVGVTRFKGWIYATFSVSTNNSKIMVRILNSYFCSESTLKATEYARTRSK